MLIENTLFGTVDRVKEAIKILRDNQPPDGYYVAFSGGKDSVVVYDLVKRAEVKYDAHYNCTTIDPPELYTFIRKYYPEVKWHYPKKPFLRELPNRGFPIRQRRWCCQYLKEAGGHNRVVVTGIRRKESRSRALRKIIERDKLDSTKTFIHPIFDWRTSDVWEYIHDNRIPYCSLYDEGWTRIGCVMCPIAVTSKRLKDAERYPRLVRAYIRAFEKMYQLKKKKGLTSVDRWDSGEEMFWWWLTGKEKFKPELWDEEDD